MSQKKKQNRYANKLDQKKQSVLDTSTNSRRPLIIAALGIVLGAVGVFAYLATSRPTAPSTAAVAQGRVTAGETTVSYPVDRFDDGEARYFQYVADGLTIRYFILRSSDGVIRAAFDACDVCWPAGRGYYQDGDQMVCRNCGRRFDSVMVNEIQGGCNPAPLVRTIDGDRLVIQVSDILAGRGYFNLSGKGART